MKTDWKALCQELLIDYEQHLYRSVLADRVRAALAAEASVTPTESGAFVMGQIGGRPSEAERLAFEAWMRGHSWLVAGTWNGVTYDDRGGNRYSSVDHDAMQTRMLWAAWRDRAALAAEADGPAVPESREPASVVGEPSDEQAQQLFDSLRTPIYGRLTTDTQDRVVGHELVRPGDFARAVLARWGNA